MNVQSSEKKKRTNQSGAPCTLATCAGNCRASVTDAVTCRFAPGDYGRASITSLPLVLCYN